MPYRLTQLLCSFWLCLLVGMAHAKDPSIDYFVEFVPEDNKAEVRIVMTDAGWMSYARFNTKDYRIDNWQGTGELEQKDDTLTWRPNAETAEISYTVDLPRQRRSGGYDSYITEDWTLLRGERIVPPIAVTRPEGISTQVHMEFTLPENWPVVHTGWPEVGKHRFHIDNPRYIFPRPAGWIVAGKLTAQQEKLMGTEVVVAAPRGEQFRPVEYLAFISMVWPEVTKAFDDMPPKILITGANDPMWRGGLSAPNSYYVHSDRPLVSANGTSTPIHELVHVVTGIHGKKTHNWIPEGVAEYYTVELLHRAGAFSAERKARVFAELDEWSQEVETLRHKNSTSRITGQAAALFHQLDGELRQRSDGRLTLDDLIRQVLPKKTLDTADLQAAFVELMGEESAVLDSELLRDP